MSGLIEFLECHMIARDLRRGRVEAVDRLFELLEKTLYHYALSVTRNTVDAEEVVQDVFLEMVRDPDRLGRVDDLKAYLYRAVRNTALNRSHRANREIPSAELLFEASAGDLPTEDRLALEQALDCLSDEQREVVVLKAWHGLAFRDIAELLQISPNTAASRYRYALEHMRTALGGKVHA